MKKKKIGIIASALMVCAICASMIAGATFALFTSEDRVNVAITSGNVDVVWDVTGEKVSRAQVDIATGEVIGDYSVVTDENVAYAKFEGKSLTVHNVVAGDRVEFDLAVKNVGSTTANYRYTIEGKNGYGLLNDMVWTIDGVLDAKKAVIGYESVWHTGLGKGATETYHVTVDVDGLSTAALVTADIELNLYAVQGNANVDVTEEAKIVTTAETATEADFESAIATENARVVLSDDVTVGGEYTFADTAWIDLNGHKLTMANSNPKYSNVDVVNGGSLTIVNGDLELSTVGASSTSPAMQVFTGSSLTVENVHITTPHTAIYPQGDAATVSVINSTVEAAGYAFGTNAATVEHYNVEVLLKDSKFVSTGTTAILFNVPGTYAVENCYVEGGVQAIYARAGDVTVIDSTLANHNEGALHCPKGDWGSGNYGYSAALLVGSKGGVKGYKHANVTVKNCTLETTGGSKDTALCVWANGNGTDFVYSNVTIKCDNDVTYSVVHYNFDAGATLTVNGKVVTEAVSADTLA